MLDGGLLASNDNELDGGPTAADFLSPSATEDNRYMQSASTSDNGADLSTGYHATYEAIAGDGTTVAGIAESGVKQGSLGAAGNGAWGSGNTCLFILTTEQLPSFG